MQKIIVFIIFLLIAGGVISLVPGVGVFEENAPNIEINGTKNDAVYWNPKNSLVISLSDESGIGLVNASLANHLGSQGLISTDFGGQKELAMELKFPANMKYKNGEEILLKIAVKDTSKAKFFAGNSTSKDIKIIIDTKGPQLSVLNQSYKIIQGGSAAAVFSADDGNGEIKELFIETSFGKKFKPVPFYKDGYYAVLLAWPSNIKTFRANVVATDLAGNTTKTPIRLYLQNKKYKESKITINDNFIDGKITELANMYASNVAQMDGIAKFKFVNEELRNSNEMLIHEITSKIPEQKLENFYIKPFYPLKNGAVVASFGDHRFFHFDGALLSESYHLGLDFASTAKAQIMASNGGKVVFAERNGIYGLNMIIYHGFGLYTLYGHCTTMNHGADEMAQEGTNIATTGTTGLALGDHLHFGILVQGIEVRPEEWMDKKWMKDNIYAILEDSKKVIDGTKK